MDILNMVNPEMIQNWASDTFKGDFTKMTLAFTIAAWLHRGWVKKDIKSYFNALTASIDNVADKVAGEMVSIKTELKTITERVSNLENLPGGKK